MFRDYTAVSSKMKSNYSKLYDITAMPWDVHRYVIPLTQKAFERRICLQIDRYCVLIKQKKKELLVKWTPQLVEHQELKHWLGLQKKKHILFNI